MHVPGLITILYYVVFSVYIFLCVYVLSLNYKGRLNRLFALSSFLMSIWALGFAMSASAINLNDALLWRRFSALGWSCVFSVIVHYVAILTSSDKTYKTSLKKLSIFYLPVIINLLLFSFITPITSQQYNISISYFGYMNVPKNNIIDIYYNLYYVISVLYSVILLYSWGFKHKNISKKSSNILIVAFIITMVAGTITDRLVSVFHDEASLQLAPLIILPTMFALYYTLKKHGSFLKTADLSETDVNRILTAQTKRSISKYLSIFILIGSIISFIYQFYLYDDPLFKSMTHSIGFLSFSMFLYLLPHLNISDNLQDILFVIVASLITPYVLLTFAPVDAAVTVWIMPLFLIFLSVLYNNRWVLIILIISSLFTYIAIWLTVPSIDVTITGQEHILRIVTVFLMAWFAFSINKIYLQKLQENKQQIKFQQLVASVSFEILSINLDNMDLKISEILAKIGSYSQVQRVYLLVTNIEFTDIQYEKEWCNKDIDSTQLTHKLNSLAFNWLNKTYTKAKDIIILHTQDLPKVATGELNFMDIQQSKTTLLLPIRLHDQLIGFLGMDTTTKTYIPSNNELKQYKTFTNIISDIYLKTNAESDIHRLAYYDPLTKLPNRTYLHQKTHEMLDQAGITHSRLALFFIDLDGFKQVNDSIGHTGGDELLVRVSERIKACIGTNDLLCRYSGDEFILVMPNISSEDQCIKTANKILSSLNQKLYIHHNEFIVTSSIGITRFPEDGSSISELIRHADLAMYEAKMAGKNQYKLCSTEDKGKLIYRNRLIQELKKAINNNEFIVYYQPQVNIKSGKIVGFEALLRWQNQSLGHVPPSIFIPIAEQSGLIKPIGEWVFNEVCKQLNLWQDTVIGQLPVAVNVSSHQFKKYELVDFIKTALANYQVKPNLIELEVTETVAIRDKENTINILNELKKLGVKIAIDDFGTAYSSLSRLKDLPIDRIKIAMKFIHGINENHKDEAIVNVIIYLAQKLGLNVIAEGVETKEQLAYLDNGECDDIQGYYFYKPMPASEIEKLEF